ncbi:putative DNA binding domain-containing protein [Candidatus Jorgensenbacteria bacterium]|nr:putative DNA binding domain-containing protein [Candidatus Jorgensenbacteria bacterium]
MHGEITTKRSPIVLMWKFAVIETFGFFLYFIATLLGNTKYELYAQFSFSNFLSYQAAKILFLLSAQFALTVYAFLSWYYEEYTIHADSITHTSGIFWKKAEVFTTNKSVSLTVKPGPLGKLFHYGSISVKKDTSSFTLSHISRPERIIKAIWGEYDVPEHAFGRKPDIEKLLGETEHDRLEFKSSLRFDYKAGNASRELEKAAMKTVAAFLNSNGGYLVIGVSDIRMPLGLKNDYQTLQRKDSDGFENHFSQSFNNMIGPEFRSFIKLWFHNMNGYELCTIQTLPSPRPVYLKIDNDEHFYMRTGNISTSLKLSEIESYARSRWPNRVS